MCLPFFQIAGLDRACSSCEDGRGVTGKAKAYIVCKDQIQNWHTTNSILIPLIREHQEYKVKKHQDTLCLQCKKVNYYVTKDVVVRIKNWNHNSTYHTKLTYFCPIAGSLHIMFPLSGIFFLLIFACVLCKIHLFRSIFSDPYGIISNLLSLIHSTLLFPYSNVQQSMYYFICVFGCFFLHNSSFMKAKRRFVMFITVPQHLMQVLAYGIQSINIC